MLQSAEEKDLNAFKRMNIDVGWAEISEDKMKEFELAMKGPEKKQFRREFARQRITTVRLAHPINMYVIDNQ